MAEENESVKAFAPRGNMWAMLRDLVNNYVFLLVIDGAPVDGTSGSYVGLAGPGSLLIDYTNSILYINTGTQASPTWVVTATLSTTLANGSILVGDGSNLAAPVAVSGDATLDNTGALTLGQVVTGAKVANVANVNVIGGVPVVFRITAAALTGDIDVVMTNKVRVIDVKAVATAAGGAGDTITVKNGANAISNAMDLNVLDTVVVRAGNLDDAQWDIAAAGTLRITGASGVSAEVIVTAIRVA